MNKIKLLIMFAAFSFSFLLMTGFVADVAAQDVERSDNVEGYEANELMTGLDIYVNETTSPTQSGLVLNEVNEQGWEIQRYFLLPASVDLADWTIIDENTIFVIGGWGGQAGPAIDEESHSIFDIRLPDLFSTVNAATEIKSEAGITGYAGRSVDGVTNVDANSELAKSDAVTIDTDFESFNATTAISGVTANYTVPVNNIDSGVHYTAGDSKTMTEYAKDISAANGKTYNSIANASMVAFAYDNFEDLEAVALTMDEESTAAPGQEGFKIRRARVWMKSKQSTVGKWGSSARHSVDKNVFSKITALPATLSGVPSGAKHFFSKTINPGHFLASKLGLGGMTSTVIKRVGAVIGIILFIVTVIGIIWLIRNRGKLMKK